jgi:predicted peroxiredoxin
MEDLKMKKTLLALTCSLAFGVAHADAQQLTVIVNSASTMTQAMAMVLATQMQAQGSQVQLLLCDKAAELALKGASGEALKPNNVTPAQMLDGAMKKGVTASVCALYLPNSGHSAEALKEGVSVGKPDAMGKAVMDPQRKVITF